VEHSAAPVYGRVPREVQARFAVEAYERAQREWPWMGAMNYWFFKRPTDSEQDLAWYYFALLEPDFSAWPAYDALSEYFQRQAVLNPGYHQEGHWALTYTGSWQEGDDPSAVLGGYRRGVAGDELRFTFWGSQLEVVCPDGADPGALEATIDGRPARVEVSAVQGRPALLLLEALSPATHTVEIRVAEGRALAVDGILVRGEDRRPACALLPFGMFLATAGMGWVLARRRLRVAPA
jgi:hypothetical protein